MIEGSPTPCSVCGERAATDRLLYVRAPGVWTDEPAGLPPRPEVCAVCADAWRVAWGGGDTRGVMRRQEAARAAFFAALPPDLPVDEKATRWVAHRTRELEAEHPDGVDDAE